MPATSSRAIGYVSVTVAAVFSLTAMPLPAQDFTWTGAVSDEWLDPDNWSPVGTPVYTNSLLIPTGTPQSSDWTIDGAIVTVDGHKTVWASNKLRVGVLDQSSSILNLTSAARIMVTEAGGFGIQTSTVNILGASVLTSNGGGVVGVDVHDRTATVNVSGVGSAWMMNNGGIIVGGFMGNGQLGITEGGHVLSQGGGIGLGTGRGNVTIDGPGSLWDARGMPFYIISEGYGNLNITNGGRLLTSTAGLGSILTADVRITGTGSSWENDGWMWMGDSGGSAHITVDDNAMLWVGNPRLGGEKTCTITVSNNAKFRGQQLPVGGLAEGILTVESGGEVWFDKRMGSGSYSGADVILNQTGTINLQGGSLKAPTIDRSAGGAFNFTGGKLQVNRFVGDLDNRGGVLAACERALNIIVEGNYSQDDNSLLLLDIGNGSKEPDVYNSLRVSGNMSLDGGLEVALWGHKPRAGDVFDLLDFSAIQGQFDTLSLPTLSSNLSWDTSMLYADGTVRIVRTAPPVIPEPMTLTMVGLAAAGVVALTRRRLGR